MISGRFMAIRSYLCYIDTTRPPPPPLPAIPTFLGPPAESRFFFKAIHSSKPALDDQPQRVENLRRSLRFTVYSWVTRGLFEKHRLIFLTQVTFGLLQVRTVTWPRVVQRVESVPSV